MTPSWGVHKLKGGHVPIYAPWSHSPEIEVDENAAPNKHPIERGRLQIPHHNALLAREHAMQMRALSHPRLGPQTTRGLLGSISTREDLLLGCQSTAKLSAFSNRAEPYRQGQEILMLPTSRPAACRLDHLTLRLMASDGALDERILEAHIPLYT